MVYPNDLGNRIAELHAADKTAGRIDTPQRVGGASGSRYMATKSLIQRKGLGEGSPLSRGLYQGTLNNYMNSSQNLLIALVVGLALGFWVGKATGHRYQGVAAGDRFFVVDQSTGVYYYQPLSGSVVRINTSTAKDRSP